MVPSPRHNDDSLTYFIASLQGPLVVNPAGRQCSLSKKIAMTPPPLRQKKMRMHAARPQNTNMNIENKQRLNALRRSFPESITLQAPVGATSITLHAQAQAAARLNDILAHVTITETGRTTSRTVSLWDESRVWDPGD